ncbi:hypothetical protein D3C87_600230 [compost metagenome]
MDPVAGEIADPELVVDPVVLARDGVVVVRHVGFRGVALLEGPLLLQVAVAQPVPAQPRQAVRRGRGGGVPLDGEDVDAVGEDAVDVVGARRGAERDVPDLREAVGRVQHPHLEDAVSAHVIAVAEAVGPGAVDREEGASAGGAAGGAVQVGGGHGHGVHRARLGVDALELVVDAAGVVELAVPEERGEREGGRHPERSIVLALDGAVEPRPDLLEDLGLGGGVGVVGPGLDEEVLAVGRDDPRAVVGHPLGLEIGFLVQAAGYGGGGNGVTQLHVATLGHGQVVLATPLEVAYLPSFARRRGVGAGMVGEVAQGVEVFFEKIAHQAADRVELLGGDAMRGGGSEGIRGRGRRVRFGRADRQGVDEGGGGGSAERAEAGDRREGRGRGVHGDAALGDRLPVSVRPGQDRPDPGRVGAHVVGGGAQSLEALDRFEVVRPVLEGGEALRERQDELAFRVGQSRRHGRAGFHMDERDGGRQRDLVREARLGPVGRDERRATGNRRDAGAGLGNHGAQAAGE